MRRIPWLLAVAALLALAVGARVSSGLWSVHANFAVSYTGTDYYFPSDYFTGCGNWTWLTSCYTSSTAGRWPAAAACQTSFRSYWRLARSVWPIMATLLGRA